MTTLFFPFAKARDLRASISYKLFSKNEGRNSVLNLLPKLIFRSLRLKNPVVPRGRLLRSMLVILVGWEVRKAEAGRGRGGEMEGGTVEARRREGGEKDGEGRRWDVELRRPGDGKGVETV
jgi:hypothetical protein